MGSRIRRTGWEREARGGRAADHEAVGHRTVRGARSCLRGAGTGGRARSALRRLVGARCGRGGRLGVVARLALTLAARAGCLRHGPRGWGRRLRGWCRCAPRWGWWWGLWSWAGCVGGGLGCTGSSLRLSLRWSSPNCFCGTVGGGLAGLPGTCSGACGDCGDCCVRGAFAGWMSAGASPAPLSGLPSRVFDRNRVLSRVGAMPQVVLLLRGTQLQVAGVGAEAGRREFVFDVEDGLVRLDEGGRSSVRAGRHQGLASPGAGGGADGRPGPGASSGSAWRRTSAVAPGASRPRTSSPSAARTAARVLQPCALRACRPSPSDPRCGRFAEDPWKSCRSMSMSPT